MVSDKIEIAEASSASKFEESFQRVAVGGIVESGVGLEALRDVSMNMESLELLGLSSTTHRLLLRSVSWMTPRSSSSPQRKQNRIWRGALLSNLQ